jgi:hypothetical protein
MAAGTADRGGRDSSPPAVLVTTQGVVVGSGAPICLRPPEPTLAIRLASAEFDSRVSRARDATRRDFIMFGSTRRGGVATVRRLEVSNEYLEHGLPLP